MKRQKTLEHENDDEDVIDDGLKQRLIEMTDQYLAVVSDIKATVHENVLKYDKKRLKIEQDIEDLQRPKSKGSKNMFGNF